MGILNKTIYYAVGNLENTEDAENWRDSLANKLKSLGIRCLDPTKPIFQDQISETEETRQQLKKWREDGYYHLVCPFMKEVIRRDLRAVDASNFIVYKIEPSKPSYGSVHEIVVASQQRKPILMIIKDKKQMPLWLMGMVNMDYVFNTEDELVGYLQKLDSGELQINSKYWKILL